MEYRSPRSLALPEDHPKSGDDMKTVADFLRRQATNDSPYVSYGEGVLRYCHVFSLSEGIAGLMKGEGVEGQNVGLFCPNSPEYVVAYFANAFSGNTNIPVNVSLTPVEIRSELTYCDCNWALCSSSHTSFLLEATAGIGTGVLEVSRSGAMRVVRRPGTSRSRVNDENVAVMLHTSGTTGRPKKVMLTHSNLIANTLSNIESLGLTDKDVVLIILPMFFGYCHTAQFLTHTRLGGKIVIFDQKILTPRHFCRLVERHRITCFTAVPTMLSILDSYPYLNKYDLTSLRYICFGGGVVSLPVLERLMDKLPGTGIVQTYGQTECSPRVTALMPPDALRKLGSVGKPIPGVEVQTVRDDGVVAGVDEVGEIRVRGANTSPGYYKRPEETAKLRRGEWLYTGDLARRDREGYYWLAGRLKNVVITGGMKVYPEEVEAILGKHPAVRESIVRGEPDEMLGEIPVADVQLNESGSVEPGELTDYLKGHLASYKVPRQVNLVKELPKTATGKLRRGTAAASPVSTLAQ